MDLNNTINISIGMQCTSAIHLRDTGKKSYSFPFDWILSHPQFVYDMLEMLLENWISIKNIVNDHFYAVNENVCIPPMPVEHYIIDKNKTNNKINNLNTLYDVIFPHEGNNKDETICKYIRRFERLKKYILDKSVFINFYYISQSSNNKGNYTIEGRNIIKNVSETLLNIRNLIKKYHGDKFIIHVYDALHMDDAQEKLENKENIQYNIINPGNIYCDLLPQII